MKWDACHERMAVRDIRDGRTYTVVGNRGVTSDGTVTATDCGAWVEATEENGDGVREVWVIHWSHLDPVRDGSCRRGFNGFGHPCK